MKLLSQTLGAYNPKGYKGRDITLVPGQFGLHSEFKPTFCLKGKTKTKTNKQTTTTSKKVKFLRDAIASKIFHC